MLSASVGGRMKANLVREIAALRQNEFFKTMAMLRAQFNLLILEAATQSQKSAMIEVPYSYTGREPYDPVDMGRSIVQQLQEDGYVVTGTYLKFRVFWDTQQSPTKKVSSSPMPRPLIRVPKA